MKLLDVPRQVRYVAKVVIVALAYYVTGRLGLLLAIPPGYATAIWPPSGIALAGALLFGYRVWPGIVLGSFFVNVGTSFDPTSLPSILKSLVLPAGIGAGAASQACLGAFLIRRLIGFPNPLIEAEDVGTFLLLGGPVSCVVNATIGVTNLLLTEAISPTSYLFSWFTWWAGDTIGVIVITPLVLAWTTEPRPIWRRRRNALTLALCITFAAVVATFVDVSAQEQARIRREFDERANILSLAFQGSFNRYLDALSSITSLYTSTSPIERQEFRTFVAPLFARYPGILALSWNPHVADDQRSVYEAAARQDGYADFQITEQIANGQLVPAARRPEYVPAFYVEPYAGNEEVLGFDVASSPIRLAGLEAARDTGSAIATGPLALVQETGNRQGFAIFMPIYDRALPHDTLEARRQHVRGYATGVFRYRDMLARSSPGVELRGLELRLYDETEGAGERLLCIQREAPAPELPCLQADDEQAVIPGGLLHSARFEVAGRRWALEVRPTPDAVAAQRSWGAWVVLAGGLLFTGLLGAFLLVVTGRSITVEQLVLDRTGELSRANAALGQELAERQRVEAELRKSQGRLAQAQRIAQLGSWEWNIATDTITWSDDLYRMYGLTPQMFDARYETFLHAVHPDDRKFVDQIVKRAFQEHTAFDFDHRILRPDGIERVLHAQGEVMLDSNSAPLRMLGIAQDITESKQREAELRAILTKTQALYSINQAVVAVEGLSDMLEAITASVVEALPANRAVLILCDLDRHAVTHLVKSGPGSDNVINVAFDELWAGLTGWALRERRPALSPKGQSDDRESPDVQRRRAETQCGAIMVVPLLYRDQPLGTLTAIRRPEESDFTQADVELLQAIANQVVIAVEYKRTSEALRQAKDELETRVQERTAELQAANVALQAEITERKRAEETLRESQARMAGMVKSAMDAIISIDDDQRILLFNAAAETMFGCLAETALGQSLDRFIPERFRAVHREHIRRFGRIGVTNRAMGALGALSGLRADGTEFPIEASISQIEAAGQRLYTVILRDITERKQAEEEIRRLNEDLEKRVVERTEQLRQSEEKFAKAFRASPAAISIAALPDGRWIEINDALAKMTGYCSEELIGHTSSELELVDRVARAKILEAIHEHGAVRNVEIQVHTKSKQIVDVLLSAEQIELDGQRCALTIHNDITELRRAEREVRRLNDDLEQRQVALEAANHDLNEFAYVVSHDLKAPLRGIGSLAEWLATDYADKLDAEGQEQLALLVGRVRRLHALIDAILSYSRVGRVRAAQVAVNLQTLVTDIIDLLAPPPAITITFEDQLPTVVGEPTRLGQVFQNLLSNAIKFMDKPQGNIRIGCQPQMGMWQLYVADNGPGIEARHFDKIFQPFQTLAPRDQVESSGIGLAVVKKVVELHGGQVWVESSVGAGSIFYFTLPGSGGAETQGN